MTTPCFAARVEVRHRPDVLSLGFGLLWLTDGRHIVTVTPGYDSDRCETRMPEEVAAVRERGTHYRLAGWLAPAAFQRTDGTPLDVEQGATALGHAVQHLMFQLDYPGHPFAPGNAALALALDIAWVTCCAHPDRKLGEKLKVNLRVRAGQLLEPALTRRQRLRLIALLQRTGDPALLAQATDARLRLMTKSVAASGTEARRSLPRL